MTFRQSLLAISLFAATSTHAVPPQAPAAADTTKAALIQIAGHATMDSTAFEYLTELSDNIGSRVTGTPEAQKAIDWSLAQMKSIGLQNVRAEKWNLWKGWTRGSAEATMLAPLHRPLAISAMGWTGSTPAAGVDAEVAAANLFDLENEMKNASRFRGKIVYVVAEGKPKQNFWSLFGEYPEFLKRLHQAGAVAVIGGDFGFKPEGMHLTHTGILGFDVAIEIPVVSMDREDESQIERFLSQNKTVRLHFNIQNQFTAGPVESANVVGEIVGREHPEQIVVVSGHLDSWDLSEGTTDNGVGVAAVLSAADAIVKSGARPRATLRFVLWTGEEQGLDGSRAYIKQHASEMKNHIAALVLDNGQGPIKEFQLGGRSDLMHSFEAFADSLENLREIKVTTELELESDTAPFILAGLPGINLNQDSPEYKFTHHSEADALEAVKPDVLTQDATVMALTAFWIADRPERFASPWPPEKTAAMLRETGNFEKVTAFGLWTFGEMGQNPEPNDK
jgi:carboxypeptidase Q